VVGLGRYFVLSTQAALRPLLLRTVAVLMDPVHSPEPGRPRRVGRGGCIMLVVDVGLVGGMAVGALLPGSTVKQDGQPAICHGIERRTKVRRRPPGRIIGRHVTVTALAERAVSTDAAFATAAASLANRISRPRLEADRQCLSQQQVGGAAILLRREVDLTIQILSTPQTSYFGIGESITNIASWLLAGAVIDQVSPLSLTISSPKASYIEMVVPKHGRLPIPGWRFNIC
jgi:hypothetical protein